MTARLVNTWLHVTHRHFRHLVATARHRELAAHRVQQRRAPLAVTGHARLQPHTGVEVADDQRHREHDREGDEVLRIADREAEARRHEHEVECGHAEQRAQNRRPAPAVDRDQGGD